MLTDKYSPYLLRFAIEIELKKMDPPDPVKASMIAVAKLENNENYYTENHGYTEPMSKAGGTHKYIKKIERPGKPALYFYTMQQIKDYKEKGILPGDQKRKGLFESIRNIFGFKNNIESEKKIKDDYKTHDIKNKYGIDEKSWINHLSEYFSNKDKWTAFFNKTKTEKTEKKENKKPDDKKEKTKKISAVNLSVMRLIHVLYGNVPIQKKEDNFATMLEQKKESKKIELDNGSKIETNIKLDEKQKSEQDRDEELAARDGYYNEKPAEILNVGKDVWGAARHNYDTYEQFNADIKQMETDGTATAYVTKKNLLGKNGLENKDKRVENGETEYKVLASYCVREYLPKVPPDSEEARTIYMDFLRAVVRIDNETTDAAHFISGLTDVYSNMFPSLSAKTEAEKSGKIDILNLVGVNTKEERQKAINIVGNSLHMIFTTFMQNPDKITYYRMDKREKDNFNILSSTIVSEKDGKKSYEDIKKDIFGKVKSTGIKIKKGDNFVLSPEQKEKFYIIQTTYRDGFSKSDYIKEKIEFQNKTNAPVDAVYYGFNNEENKLKISEFLGIDISGMDQDTTRKAVTDKAKQMFDDIEKKYLIKEKIFPENVGEVIKAGKDKVHIALKFPDGTIKAFNVKPEDIKPENVESIKRTIEKDGPVKLDLKIEKEVLRKGGNTFNLSVSEVQKKLEIDLKLKSVQYGNSMPDSERIAHTKWTLEAFSDLSEILNIPLEQISVNGKLGIAFGARGHPISGLSGGAVAHYEPGSKMINLTRANGFGSLAHEWGHFLDNIMTPSMQDYLTDFVEYENKKFDSTDQIPHGSIYIEKDSKGRETRYFFDKKANPRYPLAKLKQGQTEPDKSSSYMGLRSNNYRNVEFKIPKGESQVVSIAKEISKKNQEWLKESCDEKIRTATDDSDKIEAENFKNNVYLNNYQECFARAFETYIADKLESHGRKNTYLSSVEKTTSLDGYYIYPQGSKRQEINQLFDKFFDLIRGSEQLKKAIEKLNGSMKFVKTYNEETNQTVYVRIQ